MSRLLSVFPVAALLVAALPLSAAPRPGEKADGPAVIGQAKSLNDLLEMTKTLVKNVAGDDLYKQFEQHALPELDVKKLPGIDPRRPFGLYGTIDADLAKCRAVLLVPVTGEKDFLDMLESFDIPTNKGKEPGTFEFVTPPDVPFPVAGRVHKEYAYIAIGGTDALDTKALLDPKDVINDREKAPAYLALRLDRVPAETRKAFVGMLRERTEQLPEAIQEPELKAAFTAARNLGLRYLRLLGEEVKEVAFRLEADTKTGDLSIEMALEPMPRSPLAETIARRKPTTNAFASLAQGDAVQRLFLSAPLFADEGKEAFVKLVEYGESELAKRPNPEPAVNALVAAMFKSLKATIASGDMDLAMVLRGPDKGGTYTAVGALHCKEGAQLDKAIRDAVKALPGQASGYFKFDAHKIGTVSVHEIDLTAEAADMAKAVFGNDGNKGYFAFGKDALYAAYGPDGLKAIKDAIEAKPGPAAVMDSTADAKKSMEFVKKLMPPGNPNVGVFGAGLQESMFMGGMKVTVDGGDHLKVRIKLNMGSMIFMGLGTFAARAGPAAPPVAVVAPPPAVKK
jgi:hypothetical protein